MKKQEKISRRNLLIGLGVLGSGSLACVCAGTATAGLLWLNRNTSQQEPIVSVPTIISTQPPQVEMPPIISRQSWGALTPNHSARNESGFYSDTNIEGWRVYEDELDDAYQTVIIHHSAFYENNDFDTLFEVQTAHRNQRGWADVGYHFLIGQNGLIYEGRDWTVRGTHVETYNTGSLGICLLGNFMVQDPTEAQLNSTLRLVNWVGARLKLSHIASHRHFNPQTLCPGDTLFQYIEQFATASGLAIGTGGYIPPNASIPCFCNCCTTEFV